MAGMWRRVSRLETPIVSLAEAKRQTNTEDWADDDALLTALCGVVTRHLDLGEGVTNCALLTQDWEFTAPAPTSSSALLEARDCSRPATLGFLLDQSPLQSIVSVEALRAGAYVTIAPTNYTTRPLLGEASWLRMKDGVSWPSVDKDEAAWRVTVRLGYGDDATSIPAPLKHAALLLLAHLYQNREAVTGQAAGLAETPMAFDALIGPYRKIAL